MQVINIVKETRVVKNINQEGLAILTGTSRNTIARIEQGKRNTSVEIALRLAKYLEKTVDELFVPEDEH